MNDADSSHPAPISAPEPVGKRIVLHFPGFEPLDAAAHHERYERTAAQSAEVWGCAFKTGPLVEDQGTAHFAVSGSGPNWRTEAKVHILDHYARIAAMRSESLLAQIAKGFLAFVRVILAGGLWGYFRNAWRFAIFCFLYNFVFMALGLAGALAIVLLPWFLGLSLLHLTWSVPLGFVAFRYAFLPWTNRFYTLLLFADWRFAVQMATLRNESANARLKVLQDAAKRALAEPADDYLVTAHSMGGILATHVIGALLEEEPELFAGKRIVFAALGGAFLQAALLRPASRLRKRGNLLLRSPNIYWFEVHCLTDAVHFYKSQVARAIGQGDAPAPPIVTFRMKNLLTSERYARVKRDILRMHRQYVLGLDNRGPFDFTLATAGPLPAASFAGFSQPNLPPIGPDGAVLGDLARAA
jgi:hypothetical protein